MFLLFLGTSDVDSRVRSCLQFALLAVFGCVSRLDAQAPVRWQLTWTDASFRYVDGQQVPTGEQTAILTVTPTRGDSVHATLPTANPAITDTLDGTMSDTRLVLRSRAREAEVRRAPGAPSGGMTFVLHIELRLRGDVGEGTRRREIDGGPGIMVLPQPADSVRARRLPQP